MTRHIRNRLKSLERQKAPSFAVTQPLPWEPQDKATPASRNGARPWSDMYAANEERVAV